MKKVAILGASYLQLPLVKKAIENGLEVHCFAWDDGKAVCKDIATYFYDISVLDQEKILKQCEFVEVDGILTIATDICIPTISHVANKMGLVGNSELCASLTTNKGEMRQCFLHNGILSPKYTVVKSNENLVFANMNFPLIVKPVDRSGSLGVVKVNNEVELKFAVDNCIEFSFEKAAIVEEFISGQEVSVETLSFEKNHRILAVTDKALTEEPYFVELSHHQPSQLPKKIISEIKQVALHILKATKVENGASHIELKITEDFNIYAIEIGSRMGGDFIGSDLVQLSTGFDYLQAVLDVALNSYQEKDYYLDDKFSGVFFLSEDSDCLLKYFSDENPEDFKIIKKEILNNDLKKIKNSNDRSGYFIYQADKKIEIS